MKKRINKKCWQLFVFLFYRRKISQKNLVDFWLNKRLRRNISIHDKKKTGFYNDGYVTLLHTKYGNDWVLNMERVWLRCGWSRRISPKKKEEKNIRTVIHLVWVSFVAVAAGVCHESHHMFRISNTNDTNTVTCTVHTHQGTYTSCGHHFISRTHTSSIRYIRSFVFWFLCVFFCLPASTHSVQLQYNPFARN